MTFRNWTSQQRLMALMRLPWSVRVEPDDTDGSWVAQVAEIPDAIATGNSMKELAKDLWESLAASLEIRLEHDDTIPLPKGSSPPWDAETAPRLEVVELQIAQPTGQLIIRPKATAA